MRWMTRIGANIASISLNLGGFASFVSTALIVWQISHDSVRNLAILVCNDTFYDVSRHVRVALAAIDFAGTALLLSAELWSLLELTGKGAISTLVSALSRFLSTFRLKTTWRFFASHTTLEFAPVFYKINVNYSITLTYLRLKQNSEWTSYACLTWPFHQKPASLHHLNLLKDLVRSYHPAFNRTRSMQTGSI